MGAQMVKKSRQTSDVAGDTPRRPRCSRNRSLPKAWYVAAGLNPMDQAALTGGHRGCQGAQKISKPCTTSKEIAQVGGFATLTNNGKTIAEAMDGSAKA
jgi:chaperonin GroEL